MMLCVLSPFENRFVRLNSLACQGSPKFTGFPSKVRRLLLRQRLVIYYKIYERVYFRGQRYYFIIFIYFLKLLELRLQTKRTTAPIYKKWTTLTPPIISCQLGEVRLG